MPMAWQTSAATKRLSLLHSVVALVGFLHSETHSLTIGVGRKKKPELILVLLITHTHLSSSRTRLKIGKNKEQNIKGEITTVTVWAMTCPHDRRYNRLNPTVTRALYLLLPLHVDLSHLNPIQRYRLESSALSRFLSSTGYRRRRRDLSLLLSLNPESENLSSSSSSSSLTAPPRDFC